MLPTSLQYQIAYSKETESSYDVLSWGMYPAVYFFGLPGRIRIGYSKIALSRVYHLWWQHFSPEVATLYGLIPVTDDEEGYALETTYEREFAALRQPRVEEYALQPDELPAALPRLDLPIFKTRKSHGRAQYRLNLARVRELIR